VVVLVVVLAVDSRLSRPRLNLSRLAPGPARKPVAWHLAKSPEAEAVVDLGAQHGHRHTRSELEALQICK